MLMRNSKELKCQKRREYLNPILMKGRMSPEISSQDVETWWLIE